MRRRRSSTSSITTIRITSRKHPRASGITPEGVAWAFTSTEAANWFPVTRLSHMLDVQVFGLQSGAHHLTNVAIHAAAALLLFAFLDAATGAMWPSAFVAFLFALHPLHVESVAWVAERKDVLCAFFWFLALVGVRARTACAALCGVLSRADVEADDRDAAVRPASAGRVAAETRRADSREAAAIRARGGRGHHLRRAIGERRGEAGRRAGDRERAGVVCACIW